MEMSATSKALGSWKSRHARCKSSKAVKARACPETFFLLCWTTDSHGELWLAAFRERGVGVACQPSLWSCGCQQMFRMRNMKASIR